MYSYPLMGYGMTTMTNIYIYIYILIRVRNGVCAFITAGPITKLFAGGGRRRVEDMCYDRRRAEACVGVHPRFRIPKSLFSNPFFFLPIIVILSSTHRIFSRQ